jgi:cytochrome P450
LAADNVLAPTEVLTTLAALNSSEGHQNPYPYYARLHSYGPAIRLARGVVVHGYDAISGVLRDPNFPATNPAVISQEVPNVADHPTYAVSSNWLLTLNDDRHARLGRLLRPWFSRRRIDAMMPAAEAKVNELIDSIATRPADCATVDLIADFAEALPLAMMCDIIGVPVQDRIGLSSIANILVTATEFPSGPTLAKCDATFVQMTGYFDDLIAMRRRAPSNDLISYLVGALDGDSPGLTQRDVTNNMLALLAAGTETTTNLIGNGLNIIASDPSVGVAIRSGDMDVARFVREILRYDSPAQMTRRRGWHCEIAGVRARPDDDIYLMLGAGNRDPLRFDNPEQFDPRRTGPEPLSFGGGAHYCIGVSLARMEASIAFAGLLRRFSEISIDGTPRRKNSFLHRGFSTFPASMRVS